MIHRIALLLLFYAAACFLFLVSTPHVTGDSVGYVSMARSLREGMGWRVWDGQPTGWWPPGFPALLALFGPSLGRVPSWFPFLSAAMWCVIPWGLLTVRSGARPTWRGDSLLLLIVLASPPFVASYLGYLSEGLFLSLLSLHFVSLDELRRRPESARLRLLATLFVAALPIVRYLGAVALVSFAVGLWVALRGGRNRVLWSTVLPTLSGIPLAGLLLRNRLVLGDWVPEFPGTAAPFEDSLRRFMEVQLRWLVPQFDSADALYVTGLLVMVLIVFLLRPANWSWGRAWREVSHSALSTPELWFVSAYAVAFLYGCATRNVSRPDLRLLSPLYLGIAFVVARHGWGWLYHARRPTWGRAVAIAWVMYLLVSGVMSYRDLQTEWTRSDLGPDAPLGGELRRAVMEWSEDEKIVSNLPDRVFWHTGRSATWAPLLRGSDESRTRGILYVDGSDRHYLLSLDELDPVVELNAALGLWRAE